MGLQVVSDGCVVIARWDKCWVCGLESEEIVGEVRSVNEV